MAVQDDPTPGETVSSAARHALESARDLAARTDFDQLKTKATDAATSLYAQGRDYIANNEELSKIKDEVSDTVRRNPLAAIGIAFTAGLVFALLTRG